MYIFWSFVHAITLSLYGLVVLSLPFSAVAATVFLFAILAFWSRLPGVGIPLPFNFLYLADLADFFSMIVAINVSGPIGAVFSLFSNLVSRAVGVTPDWHLVINDAISQAILCLVIPYVHAATGSNFILSMTIYTIARILMMSVLNVIEGFRSIFEQLPKTAAVGFLQVMINNIYMVFLGGIMSSLLENEANFSWPLFFSVTAIIFFSWLYLASRKGLGNDPIMILIRGIFFPKKKTKSSISGIHHGNVKKGLARRHAHNVRRDDEIRNIKRNV